MNKILKPVLIITGIIVVSFFIVSITGICQVYTVPSAANYPTIKAGDRIFASKLLAPERFSFICYNWNDAQFGKHIRVHRLCGLEGDTIEIRDGELIVNGEFVDSNFSVVKPYLLSIKDFEKVKQLLDPEQNATVYYVQDSVELALTRKVIAEYSIVARRKVIAKTDIDQVIAAKFSADWNVDHFGPVVVPEGSYFVLGDNRNGSQDSRSLGFIPKANFVATVIGR